MGTNKSGGMILAALGIAVTLAMVLVIPAFAQDDPLSPPDPTQAPESAAAPSPDTQPEPLVTEVPGETLPTDPAPFLPLDTETVPLANPLQDSTQEMESDPSAPAQESLALALVENDLVIADTSGAPLALVSNAVSGASDPYFTVGTTKYQFFPLDDLRCDEVTIFCSATPIQAAVDKLLEKNWVPIDGTIYVETGVYTENVLIDGSLVFGTTTNKPLSLLKALKGAGSFETTDNPSIINGSVTVKNVLNGFTLSGFVIDAGGLVTPAIDINNNLGTITINDVEVKNSSGDGISITNQKGTVNLDGVSSHNNFRTGTFIDNTTGIYPVTVQNGSFNNNASGDHSNTAGGLNIRTKGLATITGVVSSNNFGLGVYVATENQLIVKHVIAIDNNINNPTYSISSIYLISKLATTIEDIKASGNVGVGILTHSGGPFTANNIVVNNNSDMGISMNLWNTISISNLTANENDGEGIFINDDGSSGHYSATIKNIESNRNDLIGIYIRTQGSIVLSDFNVDSNGSGVLLSDSSNNSSIKISNGYITNTFGGSPSCRYLDVWVDTYDCGLGLYIRANSPVFLTNVHVYGTDGGNRNYSATSYSPIPGVDAPLYGTYLDRVFPGTEFGTDEWIFRSDYFKNGANGSNLIISAQNPVKVTVFGCYSIPNVTDCKSIEDWVEIPAATYTGTEIIVNKNDIPGSPYNFIMIRVDGSENTTPTIYKVIQYPDNSDSQTIRSCGIGTPCGLYIDNAGNVTIKDSTFSNNSFSGMEIHSRGILSMDNVGANDNAGYGFFNTPQGIFLSSTISGAYNSFSKNGLDGISLISSGSVKISNLAASKNGRIGAYIDSTPGIGTVTFLHTSPDPFQLQSTFDDNGYDGLVIFSRAAVSLNDIHASNNGGYGAYIDNCLSNKTTYQCNGKGSVSLLVNTGKDNTFENNGYAGLYIQSFGAITTNNLIANGNGQASENPGVILDNAWIGGSSNVTVGSNTSHINLFSNNGEFGLDVYSYGTISVTRFEADQNFAGGIYLSNQYALTPKAVMVSYGQANDNQNGSGVIVRSKGAITITEVDSNRNDNISGTIYLGETLGEYLKDSQASVGDTWYFTLISYESNFSIDINTDFDANMVLEYKNGLTYDPTFYSGSGKAWQQVIGSLMSGQYRIVITSQSITGGRYTIALDDPIGIQSQAGASGLSLSNNTEGSTGAVKIIGKPYYGSFTNENSSNGLIIDAKGPITITNVFVNYNRNMGAVLYATSSTGSVTIGNVANQFCNNGSDGLRVKANGAITLTNVDAYRNNGYGAYLDNYQNPTSAVKITTSVLSTNWYNGFNDNSLDGLVIQTRGPVTLKQVGAADNQGNGLVIKNIDSPAKAAVSISNGFFSRNSLRGVSVETKGAVTLASLNANANDGDFGIHIITSGTGATNLSKVQANWNHAHGLFVETTFTITVNALQANENGGYGAKLVSTYNPTTLVTGITFLSTLGQNKFYGNGENLGFLETDLAGLIIQSNKAVVISQLFSGYNRGNGVKITSSAAVTVTGGLAEYNTLSGLSVTTTGGAILLSGFSAYSNGVGSLASDTGGVILSSNQKISVSNSAFHGNGDHGIRIFITAPNTLTWVNNTAFGNNLDGQAARNFKLN